MEGPGVASLAVTKVFLVAEFEKSVGADPGLEVGGSLQGDNGIIGTEVSLDREGEIVRRTGELVNFVREVGDGVVSAEGVFEKGRHAIGIEIGVGISGEGNGVAGGRIASACGAGSPGGGELVIGILVGCDEHESEAGAVGTGGPGKFVVVSEVFDRASVGGEERDVFSGVGEVADEFSGDGNPGVFRGEVSGFSDEDNVFSRSKYGNRAGVVLIEVEGDAANEFHATEIDGIIADVHQFDELDGIVVAKRVIVELGNDEVGIVGGNGVDEEARFVERAPASAGQGACFGENRGRERNRATRSVCDCVG